MIDLRIPTGLFFGFTGLILVVMGLLAGQSRTLLTTVNVNLYAGAVMLVFGVVMLLLSTRSR